MVVKTSHNDIVFSNGLTVKKRKFNPLVKQIKLEFKFNKQAKQLACKVIKDIMPQGACSMYKKHRVSSIDISRGRIYLTSGKELSFLTDKKVIKYISSYPNVKESMKERRRRFLKWYEEETGKKYKSK